MILPLISVVVPVYNVEKYLGKCVESILAQSLDDFELLLVNDASTDDSLRTARRFESDPRVKVLNKPHGGLGDTRNYGAGRASGKYLLFIDSDDWVDRNMFKGLYYLAENHNADLVVFNFIREDIESGKSRKCCLPVRGQICGREIKEKVLAEMIGPDKSGGPWHSVEMLGCAWRRMYRRDWFIANNIQYGSEQKIMLEDLPASIHAHCACQNLIIADGAYYHYRYNSNSLSTRYRPHKMEMLTECYRTVDAILQQYGIDEKYRERHMAWLLRSAAHSALVNCFSPKNPASHSERFKEVEGILKNPLLLAAMRSDYLKCGEKSDRIVRRIISTRCTPAVYLFYKIYSKVLMSDENKK